MRLYWTTQSMQASKTQLGPGDQQERSQKLSKWTEATNGHLTATTTHLQPPVTQLAGASQQSSHSKQARELYI